MALDTHRLAMWQAKERDGNYFDIRLHAYFIWDSRIHAKLYHSVEKKRWDGGRQEFDWRRASIRLLAWSRSSSVAKKCSVVHGLSVAQRWFETDVLGILFR
jgi:hypothetical protein